MKAPLRKRGAQLHGGVRYLLVSCGGAEGGQFRGVARACGMLARAEGVRHVAWRPGVALPPAAEGLRWVAVSGHGSEAQARIGDGKGRHLCPRDLRLGAGIDLYLLACHQGKRHLLEEWAGTGATVHACDGETESALSTLFLLALVEDGPESAARWFARWLDANDRLRPHFPRLRRLYREQGEDFSDTLATIGAVVDLDAMRDILAVARRHASILNDLG